MTEKEFKTGVKANKNAALRDFHIFCPPHDNIKISKGDNLDEVPKKYHQNLITEKVMKG